MDFETRLKSLNDAQRQAVDTIDGPLMVVAGPGTGKTELLSMRVANILKRTDTLPENILCLTYTDSGVAAMRRRLAEIIGPAAYKVAIHTFHSFSTEVINHNRKFFYNGANFRPADELNRFEIIKSIFDELEPSNPLTSQMNGTYTHLDDALAVISELKESGLTGAELLSILDTNEQVIEATEKLLVPIFSLGIKKLVTAEALLPTVEQIKKLSQPLDTPGIVSLADVIAWSLSAALADSMTLGGSTKPITAWRNAWFKKNERGEFILKAHERQVKLRLTASIYDRYAARMQEAGLFDFDDMILNVVHALELMPELRYNLQEKYLYFMVDEFQDTNLAQMRILLSLISSEINEGNPNIMVVGDDDQAIYGFQGATVSNIHGFIEKFPSAPRIVLTDNYRSTADILDHSRSVIRLGEERLEKLLGIEKNLKAKAPQPADAANTRLIELPTAADERDFIVREIAKRIEDGATPGSIAVLARRHSELINLLPHFIEAGIKVNYERRDNVLELESIQLVEYIAELLIDLLDGKHDKACSKLPELLAHPAFDINPLTLWQLSLRADRERKNWLELMPDFPELAPIHSWLLEQSKAAAHTPLERMCDIIIGTPESLEEGTPFVSPIYNHYFAPSKLSSNPDLYLTHLGGLITIRARLREHYPEKAPTLRTFLDFLNLQRESGMTITSIQPVSQQAKDAVVLMTAHKSKGLEFDTVYITGAVDSAWGEKARSRSRFIGYPENLPLKPAGDSPDDRLRLFFVAMTRAKASLTITYNRQDDKGKEQLLSGFLTGEQWQPEKPALASTDQNAEAVAKLSWYQPLMRPITPSMREILAPSLENYKLNATHLANFLDLTRGGPESFVINNLLKFPQAPSPALSYGNAIHRALQRAHTHTVATGEQRPHEDIIKDFETALDEQHLPPNEFEYYLQKGSDTLRTFLASERAIFTPTQKTELNFGGQGVQVGDAKLTGIIDVMNIEENSVTIADYKTGKASYSWKGRDDYEKVKLHRYRRQLLFYDLLVSGSRDFSKYSVENCAVQFVEPTRSGDISCLEASFTNEDRERLKKLIQAVWRHIITLDMPDTSGFEPTFKGMLDFEQSLIDETY